MSLRRRPLPWKLLAVVAVGTLWCWSIGVTWAPEGSIRLASSETAVTAAAGHADGLGFDVGAHSRLRLSAGPDGERLKDPGDVLLATDDPDDRRRLLAAAPPLRVQLTFDATSADGIAGELQLEVGGDGQLVDARFDVDPRDLVDGVDDDDEASMGWADDVAEVFFDGAPPDGRTEANRTRVYRAVPGPYLEVRGQADGDWRASLLPAEPGVDEDGPAIVALLVLAIFGVMMLVLFLWRLSRARLGFGHVKVIASVVALFVLGSSSEMTSWTDLALYIAFAAPSLGVLLIGLWAVTEAELRDCRPRALDSWDRFVYRQPLRTTGHDLVVGVAWGAVLACLFASSGHVGSLLGGGYTQLVGRLGDQLVEAMFLVLLTAFGAGCGGRMLGPRTSVVFGALGSACLWLILLPVSPLGVRIAGAALLGAATVFLVLRRGLLTATVATVVALALPSVGLVALTWPRWWLGSLVGLAVCGAILGRGLWLRRTAPTMGSPDIKPAYLSKIERIARLETEVELLRNFQLALLPEKRLVRFEGGEAAWRMHTADQVGGDYVDFVTDEAGRLWMSIADVAGHGIACSMFTAFAKAAVAEHAAAGVSPAEALTRIRRLFRRLRSRRSMVTMILAVWDPRDRTLSVASAGHPPLVLWDGERNREVGPPSRPLGIDLPGEDRFETVVCPPGSIVLGYTDGVVEAISPFGEAFGFDRWPTALAGRSGQPATAVLDSLLAELDQHRGNVPADDDVTAVVLTIT